MSARLDRPTADILAELGTALARVEALAADAMRQGPVSALVIANAMTTAAERIRCELPTIGALS